MGRFTMPGILYDHGVNADVGAVSYLRYSRGVIPVMLRNCLEK